MRGSTGRKKLGVFLMMAALVVAVVWFITGAPGLEALVVILSLMGTIALT